MRIGSGEVREVTTTESKKAGGDRARGFTIGDNGLLAGTNVANTLISDPPSMAGLVATPTRDLGAVSGS
jgi:hypothetical protein